MGLKHWWKPPPLMKFHCFPQLSLVILWSSLQLLTIFLPFLDLEAVGLSLPRAIIRPGGWQGDLCIKRLMNSQARPSHSFFQWVSPQLLFWALGFLNICMEGQGLKTVLEDPDLFACHIFFSFQLYNLALPRNSHISNCLPEFSLAFPVPVRYYGLP